MAICQAEGFVGPRRAGDPRRGGQPQVRLPHLALPASGFTHCTDTFLFDDAGKIVRQTVCILNEGAPALRTPLCGSRRAAPVQDTSWDNHFAAFGAQDVDKILLDYTEKSTIKVYNQVTDELTEFKGLKAVKECFTGLFSDLSDLSGRRRGAAIRVEEATEGKAGIGLLDVALARGTTTRPFLSRKMAQVALKLSS